MSYNYYLALCSVFFLTLTTIFYLRQNRMHDLQNHLFTVMLIGGLVAVTFDFIAGALNPIGASVPAWALYASNALFILGEHACLPAFFLYTVAASEKFSRLNKLTMSIAMTPFLLICALVILSFFTQSGIFYIDENHFYVAGKTHMALYVVAGFYLAGSCVLLAGNYKVIATRRLYVIMGFALAILIASLIQILFPKMLVTTPATALSLTGMYFLLRQPGEQVDSFTGAFVRTLMPNILRGFRDKNHDYTLILYSLLNFDDIARTQGVRLADGLIVSLSVWLRQHYPKDTVVYMNSSEFTVILDRVLEPGEIAPLLSTAPLRLPVEGSDIPIKLAISVLPCLSETTTEKALTTADYLFRQMRERGLSELFVADEQFLDRYDRIIRMEESLEDILQSGVPELATSNVLRSKDSIPAFIDVSLRVRHEAVSELSAGELFYALKQTGNIPWYYEQLMTLVGKALPMTDRAVRFCLPLYASALIQDDLADMLLRQAQERGISPERIVFRFSESEVADSLTIMAKNISALHSSGFRFRLDGFAEGYTDMSLLTELPIDAVTIDESLLRSADKSIKAGSLLGCVVDILLDVGKEVICAGIDTRHDAEKARSAGAQYLKGRWCRIA